MWEFHCKQKSREAYEMITQIQYYKRFNYTIKQEVFYEWNIVMIVKQNCLKTSNVKQYERWCAD